MAAKKRTTKRAPDWKYWRSMSAEPYQIAALWLRIDPDKSPEFLESDEFDKCVRWIVAHKHELEKTRHTYNFSHGEFTVRSFVKLALREGLDIPPELSEIANEVPIPTAAAIAATDNESPQQRRERLKEEVAKEKATGNRAWRATVAKREGISGARLGELTRESKSRG